VRASATQLRNVFFLSLAASSIACSSSSAGSDAPLGGGAGSTNGTAGSSNPAAGAPAMGAAGVGGKLAAGGSSAAGATGSSAGGVGQLSGGAGGTSGGSAGSVGIGVGGAAGGSASGPACDKSMAIWTDDADNYASHDFGPSFLRKNFWNARATGSGTLSLWAASSRCWGVDATSQDTVMPGTVKSYPDMARGWVVGTAGFQNPNSGLPIQVSALKKAKIRWKMSVSGTPLRHYALWDIYFHESASPGRGTAPVNLMIKQRVVDPDHYEQDTESGGEEAVTHTFSGITFRENKNSGLKSGSRIVVELFATPVNGSDMGIDDMTLDLKEVIDYYVKDGSILSTDYLTSIQTGWEILAGGTFVTSDFWTALQDEPEPTN
jgi:hypothetical protein